MQSLLSHLQSKNLASKFFFVRMVGQIQLVVYNSGGFSELADVLSVDIVNRFKSTITTLPPEINATLTILDTKGWERVDEATTLSPSLLILDHNGVIKD